MCAARWSELAKSHPDDVLFWRRKFLRLSIAPSLQRGPSGRQACRKECMRHSAAWGVLHPDRRAGRAHRGGFVHTCFQSSVSGSFGSVQSVLRWQHNAIALSWQLRHGQAQANMHARGGWLRLAKGTMQYEYKKTTKCPTWSFCHASSASDDRPVAPFQRRCWRCASCTRWSHVSHEHVTCRDQRFIHRQHSTASPRNGLKLQRDTMKQGMPASTLYNGHLATHAGFCQSLLKRKCMSRRTRQTPEQRSRNLEACRVPCSAVFEVPPGVLIFCRIHEGPRYGQEGQWRGL